MKKGKILKAVCATVLAAATIGMVAPKAADNLDYITTKSELSAPAASTGLGIKVVPEKTSSGFKTTLNAVGVQSPGINSVEFAVKYDPSVVKVTKVSAGSGLADFDDDCWFDDGEKICIAWASLDSALTKDGPLFILEGTLKSDSNTSFSIVSIDRAETPGSSNKNDDILVGFIDPTKDDTDPGSVQNYDIDDSDEYLEGDLEVVPTPTTTTTAPVTTTTTAPVTTTAEKPDSTEVTTTTDVPVTTTTFTDATTTTYIDVTTTSTVPTTSDIQETTTVSTDKDDPATSTTKKSTTTTKKVTTTKKSTTTTKKVTTTTKKSTTTTKKVTTTTTKKVTTTTKKVTTTKPTTTTTTITDPSFVIGDINLDRKVEVADVVGIQKFLTHRINFNEKQFRNADINGDGTINVFDAIELRRIILNK